MAAVTALIAIDQPDPITTISTPEIAGPISPPRWKIVAFSAIALRRRRDADHLADECGARRAVDRHRRAGDGRDHEDVPRPARHPSSTSAASTPFATVPTDWRDQQYGAPVGAIGDHAGPGPEQQRGRELERDREPDEGDVAGQLEHQPVDGDARHPAAGVREQLRDDVEPVVVRPQSARTCRASAGPGLEHGDGCGDRRKVDAVHGTHRVPRYARA